MDEWLPRLEGGARPYRPGESEPRQADLPASLPATDRTDDRKTGKGGGKAAWLAAAVGLLLVVGLGVVWLVTEQDAGEAVVQVALGLLLVVLWLTM